MLQVTRKDLRHIFGEENHSDSLLFSAFLSSSTHVLCACYSQLISVCLSNIISIKQQFQLLCAYYKKLCRTAEARLESPPWRTLFRNTDSAFLRSIEQVSEQWSDSDITFLMFSMLLFKHPKRNRTDYSEAFYFTTMLAPM